MPTILMRDPQLSVEQVMAYVEEELARRRAEEATARGEWIDDAGPLDYITCVDRRAANGVAVYDKTPTGFVRVGRNVRIDIILARGYQDTLCVKDERPKTTRLSDGRQVQAVGPPLDYRTRGTVVQMARDERGILRAEMADGSVWECEADNQWRRIGVDGRWDRIRITGVEYNARRPITAREFYANVPKITTVGPSDVTVTITGTLA